MYKLYNFLITVIIVCENKFMYEVYFEKFWKVIIHQWACIFAGLSPNLKSALNKLEIKCTNNQIELTQRSMCEEQALVQI